MTVRTKKIDGPPAGIAEILHAMPDASALDELLQRSPIDAKTLIALAEYLDASAGRRRQQLAANIRHAPRQKAKEFVINLWHLDRRKYKYIKDFSEAAAVVVSERFELSVKPETIARDWLRGVAESSSMRVHKKAIAFVDGTYVRRRLRLEK